ncbi:MAG: hypothetical protein HFE78_02460 [Clostridiales bacterium]|nr:hypothetical protein [Clostridiales bacterium]
MTGTKTEYLLHVNRQLCLYAVNRIRQTAYRTGNHSCVYDRSYHSHHDWYGQHIDFIVQTGYEGLVFAFSFHKQPAGENRCSEGLPIGAIERKSNCKMPDGKRRCVGNGALLTYDTQLCQNTRSAVCRMEVFDRKSWCFRRRERGSFCADGYKVMIYLYKATIYFWNHYDKKVLNQVAKHFCGGLV